MNTYIMNCNTFNDFKTDAKSSSYQLSTFMKKWQNHPKYYEYEQKLYDEDFEEWVKESYNYDESLIRGWKIFKNTCDIYVKCLNNLDQNITSD